MHSKMQNIKRESNNGQGFKEAREAELCKRIIEKNTKNKNKQLSTKNNRKVEDKGK